MLSQEPTLFSAFEKQYKSFGLIKKVYFPKAPSPLAGYGNNFVWIKSQDLGMLNSIPSSVNY